MQRPNTNSSFSEGRIETMQKQFFFLLFGSAIAIALPAVKSLRSASPTHPSTAIQTEYTIKGKDAEGTVLETAGVDASSNSLQRSLKLKISEVTLDAQDPERETYLYTVLYQDPTSLQWRNLCQPDRDQVAKAIPLSGSWDETGAHLDDGKITFGCTSGALAKCVRWGYKPWKTVQGRSLRAFHQACTRMVRADYCGTGKGHTQDGTAIDIYDRLGIQKRTPQSGMTFEAAWQPDGATLIQRTRRTETLAQIQQECPNRLKERTQNSRSKTVAQMQQFSKALLFNDSLVQSP
ncbi:ADYC domain-containing protein [Leptolyngbya sp. NIES-2104]|uniref:ADYC domain-containing protein n=1 Tax=Leptolyngbya sp. NIES-2104 TaxID=1552121 RepID=UPI000B143F7E|nr:ADYC domain-containing protein [Leptolyngbya sp. NIES-2104]